MIELDALARAEAGAVERLLDQAFGTDRRARTAYAVRAGTHPVAELGFAAFDGPVLVGTIQCWPVALRRDAGDEASLVMIGPVAVAPERQRSGIGRALMRASLAAAARTGHADALALIGDPEYYGRFFGFSAERTGGWRLPGPVERRRLLARGAGVPDGPGVLGPRLLVDA